MIQIAEAVECMPSLVLLEGLHLICPSQEISPQQGPSSPNAAISEWLGQVLDYQHAHPQGRAPLPGGNSHHACTSSALHASTRYVVEAVLACFALQAS